MIIMLEKDIERHYGENIKKEGGEFLKWVSPGNAGVPDRIVLLPGGKIRFIEFKKPGGRLSALQKYWGTRLQELGFEWGVIDCERENKKL